MKRKYYIEPSDLIGLIAVTGCLVLIGLGRDSVILATLGMISAYYFGNKTRRN